MNANTSTGPVAVIGLGNPGKKYSNTRHNLGFDVVDCLAARFRWNLTPGFKGQFGQFTVGAPKKKVFFLKPETFMNVSGASVRELMTFYKIKTDDVLVVHDDLDQKLGALKLSHNGSDAGHNGIKSIYSEVGKSIWRLKLGIGRPEPGREEVADYVLSHFRGFEKKIAEELVETAADAVMCFLEESTEKTMSRFNRKKSPLDEGEPHGV